MATHPPDGNGPGHVVAEDDTKLDAVDLLDGDAGASRKARLRTRFARARGALTPQQRARQSRAVADQLADWLLAHGASPQAWLAIYHPTRTELDPRLLVERLTELHGAPWPTAFPRCVDGATLELCPAPDDDRGWVRNCFDIPEPATPALETASIGFVIVPALAVDRDGTRLGYGGGYYDRFLASAPTLAAATIATVFDVQLAAPHTLVRETFDVPVAWIATPAGIERTTTTLTTTPGAG